METQTIMTCRIIAHTSNRYAATYRVQAHGRVYKLCVEDHPGEDCTVHIDGVDEGSELFWAIQGVVLKDWLGVDVATRRKCSMRSRALRPEPSSPR